MPYVSSAKEARAVYMGFSGYREKLKKFGIVAIEINEDNRNSYCHGFPG